MDCIGVDLWADGTAGLKVYERQPFLPDKISDPAIKRSCIAIARRHAVRDLLFLRRVSSTGDLAAPAKTILRLQDGIEGEALPSVAGLASYKGFLTQHEQLSSGLRICYVGFDDKRELEICMRPGLPPWARV
ncbi:MAG: hypothetical protein WC881_00790 [Elusimicrobiota bacterium]